MQSATQGREVSVRSGWSMLFTSLFVLVGGVILNIVLIGRGADGDEGLFYFLPFTFFTIPGGILMLAGLFTLQPNEARVMTLFGAYKGTVRSSGFFWTNPFYKKQRVSLRSRNLDGQMLKVNDKRGNPIEISAVIVWRVVDPARAVFDVENFEHYVRVQSESSVRNLASDYSYDRGEDDEITLRADANEVSIALKNYLQEQLQNAGVEVEQAKLNHLAYAPEIASAMLKRQQAEAIISARKKIVHGAVSMVEMALQELDSKSIVELDADRKAAMVSNLLVILCGESEAQPVLNTGS